MRVRSLPLNLVLLALAVGTLPGCSFIDRLGREMTARGNQVSQLYQKCQEKVEGACDAWIQCSQSGVDDCRKLASVQPILGSPPAVSGLLRFGRGGGAAGGNNGDECDPPGERECSASPDGRHHFVGKIPPTYRFFVKKDNTCWRQALEDCEYCHTTYIGNASEEQITFPQITSAVGQAAAAKEALAKAAGGMPAQALLELLAAGNKAGFEAKIAESYWSHIFEAQDNAETSADRHGLTPCVKHVSD